MPFIEPMLATPGRPRQADGWVVEFKWDGVRVIVEAEPGSTRLWSRNGAEITVAYPELSGLGPAIGRSATLDGELVALDASGRPSFSRLQRRMHLRNPILIAEVAGVVPVVVMLFDVLALDGESVTTRPYVERRGMLETLVTSGTHWQVPPTAGDIDQALGVASRLGLEGIVCKRGDAPYRPGTRSDAWRKVRLVQRQEFVVAGMKPGTGSRSKTFGSLLVGWYDDNGDLHYAGHVGSGYRDADLTDIHQRLTPVEQTPFVDGPGYPYVPVEPTLVIEVQFREWTPDGSLRQPSYKGIRTDKDPRAVGRS